MNESLHGGSPLSQQRNRALDPAVWRMYWRKEPGPAFRFLLSPSLAVRPYILDAKRSVWSILNSSYWMIFPSTERPRGGNRLETCFLTGLDRPMERSHE